MEKVEELRLLVEEVIPGIVDSLKSLTACFERLQGLVGGLYSGVEEGAVPDVEGAEEEVSGEVGVDDVSDPLDSAVEHKKRGKQKEVKTPKDDPQNLRVTFKDGAVIYLKEAAKTLEECVNKIGVADVRRVVVEKNLKFSGIPLISNRRDDKSKNEQRPLGDGWWLVTHSSTKDKARMLRKISDALGLGLKIELLDKKDFEG